MKNTLLACAAAVLALAACGDSTGSGGAAGTVSYTYTGSRNGSYSAHGTFGVSAGTFIRREFAVATMFNTGTDALGIVAYHPVSTSHADVALITIPHPSGPGSWQVSFNGCQLDCAELGFVFNLNGLAAGSEAETTYYMDHGTVTLTSLSATHAEGTFQGIAVNFSGAADSIVITNGKFSVPISAEASVLAPSKSPEGPNLLRVPGVPMHR